MRRSPQAHDELAGAHVAEGPKALGMYERGLELDGNHAALKAAIARVKNA